MHLNLPSPEHPPAIPLLDTPDPISPGTPDSLSLQAPQILPTPDRSQVPSPSSMAHPASFLSRHLTFHHILKKLPAPLPAPVLHVLGLPPNHPFPPDIPDTSKSSISQPSHLPEGIPPSLPPILCPSPHHSRLPFQKGFQLPPLKIILPFHKPSLFLTFSKPPPHRIL